MLTIIVIICICLFVSVLMAACCMAAANADERARRLRYEEECRRHKAEYLSDPARAIWMQHNNLLQKWGPAGEKTTTSHLPTLADVVDSEAIESAATQHNHYI